MSSDATRKFHFIREIAAGGFGAVYLAKVSHADGFSRLVAVKLLHPQWSENEEIAKRMRDEARLLGWLRHRNIVDVIDLTRIDGRVAVIMEYLEAVDCRFILSAYRERGVLVPLRVILEIGAAVASALDAAYNRPPYAGEKPLRVIHRDIKPSNIMVDQSGLAKVLDFGVARADFDERESHTQGVSFGSLEYMAPERLFMEPDTPASDIYALGVTLYELITFKRFGKAKMKPGDHESLIFKRLETLLEVHPLPDENVGETLLLLLNDMITFDQASRPTAGECVTRLRALAREVRRQEGLEEWAERAIPPMVKQLQAMNTGPADPAHQSLVDRVLTEDSRVFSGARVPEPPPPEASSAHEAGLTEAPAASDAAAESSVRSKASSRLERLRKQATGNFGSAADVRRTASSSPTDAPPPPAAATPAEPAKRPAADEAPEAKKAPAADAAMPVALDTTDAPPPPSSEEQATTVESVRPVVGADDATHVGVDISGVGELLDDELPDEDTDAVEMTAATQPELSAAPVLRPPPGADDDDDDDEEEEDEDEAKTMVFANPRAARLAAMMASQDDEDDAADPPAAPAPKPAAPAPKPAAPAPSPAAPPEPPAAPPPPPKAPEAPKAAPASSVLSDEEAEAEAAGMSIDDSWGGASTSPDQPDDDALPEPPAPAPAAAEAPPAAPASKPAAPAVSADEEAPEEGGGDDENVSFFQILLGGGMFFVVGSGIGLLLLLAVVGALYATNPSLLDPVLGGAGAPASPASVATPDPAPAAPPEAAPGEGGAAPDGPPAEAAAEAVVPDGPHVAFSTSLGNMKKLRARCDSGSAEGVSGVVIEGETPGTCTVTALTKDRKRLTVVIEKTEPRAYTCFADGEKECK